MKPITNILVPLDFSEHSAAALKYAVDLARHYEATLQLLHVFAPVFYSVPEGYLLPGPAEITQVRSALEQELERAKHDACAGGALIVKTLLLEGHPPSEILRVAREGGFDLIVMGTHGRTGVKHVLIGSVAENVVRHAPCPVLTVRTPKHPKAEQPPTK